MSTLAQSGIAAQCEPARRQQHGGTDEQFNLCAGACIPIFRGVHPTEHRGSSDNHLERNIEGTVILDPTKNEDTTMDKDRIKGSAEQAKGAVKEAAGKVFGDKKLETEGKTEKAAGKVQNAIGGLKDAVRGK